jgi:hypothetical protein
MEHLTAQERTFLKSLSTPLTIQNYLDSIPFNHEKNGETDMSPRRVIREGVAHCFEGALLACAALILQGRKPLIVSLKVLTSDYDHIITLFKENGYWGAISKTNHAVLGYRDPVYKSIRELVMTYFHEYFLVSTGEKTLRGYSRPINLNRFGEKWITTEENLYEMAETIYDSYHQSIIPEKNLSLLRTATILERRSANLVANKKETPLE